MDAIKKTQQLRLKEVNGTSLSEKGGSKNETPRTERKPFGMAAKAVSAIILLVIAIVLGWNAFFPLLSSSQSQKEALIVKKEPPAVHQGVKRDSQETSDIATPMNQGKEPPPSTHPFVEKKRKELLVKKTAKEKKTRKTKPHKKTGTEKGIIPPGSPTDKTLKMARLSLKKELQPNSIRKEPYAHPRKKGNPQNTSEIDPLTNQTKKSQPSKEPFIKETAPPSLKKGTPPGSIGLRQEGEKDSTLTSDALTTFNLGVHLYNQGEIAKAIKAYKMVVELDPTYIEAYNNLGIIYQEIGDFDRAFGAYKKTIDIDPQYEKGHNNLGIILYLKGRYEEAMEAFQKALVINSFNIETLINLGILFKKQGELGNAVKSYKKALAIDPLHGETHYNIALLHEQSENLELAIGHYKKFIQLSSKTRPVLVSKVKRHLDFLIRKERF